MFTLLPLVDLVKNYSTNKWTTTNMQIPYITALGQEEISARFTLNKYR